MRIILAALLCLLSLQAAAQHPDPIARCRQYVVDTTDEITGNREIRSREIFPLSSRLDYSAQLSVAKHKSTHYLFFSLKGKATCTRKSTRVYTLYTDGSRGKFTFATPVSCEGSFLIPLDGMYGKTKLYKDLRDKRLKAMRVETQTDVLELYIDQEDSETLSQTMLCFYTFF